MLVLDLRPAPAVQRPDRPHPRGEEHPAGPASPTGCWRSPFREETVLIYCDTDECAEQGTRLLARERLREHRPDRRAASRSGSGTGSRPCSPPTSPAGAGVAEEDDAARHARTARRDQERSQAGGAGEAAAPAAGTLRAAGIAPVAAARGPPAPAVLPGCRAATNRLKQRGDEDEIRRGSAALPIFREKSPMTVHTADSATSTAAALRELKGLLGDRILLDEEVRDLYRSDFGRTVDRLPGAVARCTSAEEVAAVVRFCRERKIPVTPRGQAHTQTGQATTDRRRAARHLGDEHHPRDRRGGGDRDRRLRRRLARPGHRDPGEGADPPRADQQPGRADLGHALDGRPGRGELPLRHPGGQRRRAPGGHRHRRDRHLLARARTATSSTWCAAASASSASSPAPRSACAR